DFGETYAGHLDEFHIVSCPWTATVTGVRLLRRRTRFTLGSPGSIRSFSSRL
ncbi:MAG: hypothetical protein QOH40_3102, partial [Arthrobacter pascens]|nr:hypothetical protein [Arthrobacter pascens]